MYSRRGDESAIISDRMVLTRLTTSAPQKAGHKPW